MALEDIISPYDIPSERLFHFAMAVPDLPAAMELLGPALNVNWTSVWSMTREMDTPEGHTRDEMQAVYSRQGPPYVELVNGHGSGFFAADQGPRLHHVGYIVDDVRVEAERLQALGMTIWDLGPASAFVTNDVGMTFEIMGQRIRETLDEWFARPSDQSAVGGSLSLRKELKWVRIEDPPVSGVDAWHVNGSPASAVIVGLDGVLDEPPDLLVSGINQGANMGNDLTASGTVGAALQGHFRGITSLALSYAMMPRTEVDWDAAERVAAIICREEIEGHLPKSILLNVNIPLLPFEEIKGVLVTRAARRGFFHLDMKGDTSGELRDPLQGLGELTRRPFTPTPLDPPPGTDFWAIIHKYVSVSPLQANFTDHHVIDALGDRFNAAWGE